jgi:hypothetical protein
MELGYEHFAADLKGNDVIKLEVVQEHWHSLAPF